MLRAACDLSSTSRLTPLARCGQVFAQDRAVAPNLDGDLSPLSIPAIVGRGPLQFLPLIAFGRGFRPEHVRTPDQFRRVEPEPG